MAATVSCADCRTAIAQSQSFFGTDGSTLCARCHAMREAHAQVERGRAAAYEEAAAYRGAVGLVVQAVKRGQADDEATRHHADLAAIRAAGPRAAEPQPCHRCGVAVAPADIHYALDGQTLCRACSITYDAAAERKKIEGNLWFGLALGFSLSFVGVAVVHALGRPPGEKRGALVGAGVGAIFMLVALRVVGAMAR
ncbi:MAG: hypothetical protein KF819_11985 [Labilithrix sp.]|nr:hypothetical protein [Labilithrix sp.]